MATLKELMGDLTRGDGRMFFNMKEMFTFEPIFKSGDYWYGLKLDGDCYCANHVSSPYWSTDLLELNPKKKVKMYRPIFCGENSYRLGEWRSFKKLAAFDAPDMVYGKKLTGWQEMEVEVEENEPDQNK